MDRLFNLWQRETKREIQSLPPRLLEAHPELIDRNRLTLFQNWANKKGEGGLFGKLIENLRYIDKENMQVGLDWMKNQAETFIGNSDYVLALHRRDHSGEWIFNQLNLRPPIAIVDGFGLQPEMNKRQNKNIKILFPDDASYSGSQVVATFNSAIKERAVSPKNLGLFFLGTTNMAEKTIQKYFRPGLMVSKFNIPTISDLFNNNEKTRLQIMFDGWSGHYDQAVLTFLWSRIPDNFFGGLKSSIGQNIQDSRDSVRPNHYLFNDWKDGPFNPPYRKKTKF